MVILTVVLSCRNCFLNQASYDGGIVAGWSVKEENLSEISDSQLIVFCHLSPEEQEKKCFADRVRV